MNPTMCRVKHEPPTSYGDCLRACIATVMDVERAEDVPHFADGGVDGPTMLARVRDWLAPQHTIAGFAFPASPLNELLDWMAVNNPTVTWLLFGNTGHGDHVVVCQGGVISHDPAWVPSSIKSPGSSGAWEIWVVSRV